MRGFLEFVRTQGIVGLAVGFLLGGAVSKLVSALIEDIINPLLGIVLGAVGNFNEAVLVVGPAKIKYGHFIGTLLDFVVISFIVYYVFKKLESTLDKKKG